MLNRTDSLTHRDCGNQDVMTIAELCLNRIESYTIRLPGYKHSTVAVECNSGVWAFLRGAFCPNISRPISRIQPFFVSLRSDLEHIAAANALASKSKANGEPFPIHKLPTPLAVKKEATGDAALMRRTFVDPSYGPNTQPYNQIKITIAKWIVADCLPYKAAETRLFRAMMRIMDPKCPDFGRKAIMS